MARLQVDGVRRLRKSRIGKRACGNRCQIGQAFRFPEHRRTAVRTEVEGHRKSAVGLSHVKLGAAMDRDVLVAKESGDAVRAACALLAGEAVAK